MYGWDLFFGKMIDSIKKLELKIVRKTFYTRAVYMTFILFTTRLAVFCTITSACLMYGSENISVAKVTIIMFACSTRIVFQYRFLILRSTDVRYSFLFSTDCLFNVSNVYTKY